MESQRKHPRAFSFEFFPPRTEQGIEKLRATWRQLAQLKPRFFSVTYGAGGTTRERTLGTVLEIREAGYEAAPHISCVGSSRADIAATIELYRSKGIRHIVALRGDVPSGTASPGELRYASELVQSVDHLIRLVGATPVGENVPVVIRRAGEDIELRATIAPREAVLTNGQE